MWLLQLLVWAGIVAVVAVILVKAALPPRVKVLTGRHQRQAAV